jgi:hypothetical protein
MGYKKRRYEYGTTEKTETKPEAETLRKIADHETSHAQGTPKPWAEM